MPNEQSKPTLDDTLAALKMYLGKSAVDTRYDVNGDGSVNLNDVLGLQKASLGKDPGFAFTSGGFLSPVNRTVEDYAAEKKASEERQAAEAKETARQKTLLEEANKYTAKNATGAVTMEDVKANPNMTAEQLANKHVMDYWSGQSEAYSRVMKAMNDGTAKFAQIPSGVDQDGYQVSVLGLTSDPSNPNSNNSLTLTPTGTPNVYQFSTHNQVAGGNIHGLIAGNPETGQYMPVSNAATMTQYTPGSPGGWARNAIGDIGDMLKAAGPLPALIGNAILPGAGSALAAVLALDEGNKSGAALNALAGAASYGNVAAQNALAAEVSGNVDLANQYSSGLQGALAENAGNLNTAKNVAQLANAVETGNVGSALSAAGSLTGVSPNPTVKTGMAVAGLAQALNTGNTAQALLLAGELSNSSDLKLAGQANKVLNAINSGNMPQAIADGIDLAKASDSYVSAANAFEQDVNSVLDTKVSSAPVGPVAIDQNFLIDTFNQANPDLVATNPADVGPPVPTDYVAPPGGTQLAAADTGTMTDAGGAFTVNVGGVPIYKESSGADSVSAPFGYELMSSALNEKGLRPEGAYYDETQNAWFTPSVQQQNQLTDLQDKLTQGLPGYGTLVTDPGTQVDPNAGSLGSESDLASIDTGAGSLGAESDLPPLDPNAGSLGSESDLPPQGMSGTPNASSTSSTSSTSSSTGSPISISRPSVTNFAGTSAAPTATTSAAKPATPYYDYNKIYKEDAPLNPLLFSLAGFGPLQKPGEGSGKTMTAEPTEQDIMYGTSFGDQPQQPQQQQELTSLFGFAEGGHVQHPMGEPEFYSQGGLNNLYVEGRGDGTSDDVPAMVANNEYVLPADIVSSLGNGSSDAGASILDQFVKQIRSHKHSNPPSELPPDSLGPLEYLSMAANKKGRA